MHESRQHSEDKPECCGETTDCSVGFYDATATPSLPAGAKKSSEQSSTVEHTSTKIIHGFSETIRHIYIIYDCAHDQAHCERLKAELSALPYPVIITGKTSHKDNRHDIARSDLAIIIVGHQTWNHKPALSEIWIIRNYGLPFVMLQPGIAGTVEKPDGMMPQDKIYVWTTENLEYLMEGVR